MVRSKVKCDKRNPPPPCPKGSSIIPGKSCCYKKKTLSSYTVVQLREMLQSKNLSTKGLKAELIERLEKSPPKVPKQCTDWQTCITRQKISGFTYIVLPKDTLLYKGVGIGKNVRPLVEEALYAADLNVASYYAFQSERRGDAEYGKILVYSLQRDIYLLDMAELENYRALYKLGVEIPQYNKDVDIINYSFGYKKNQEKLERYSHPMIDGEFVDWLCKLDIPRLDGYAYEWMAKFHNEVVICNKKYPNLIKLEPIEYRYTKYLNENAILKVINGEFTGQVIPFAELSYKAGTKIHNVQPYIKYRDTLYFPDIKLKEDAFLCSREFLNARTEYVKKYSIKSKETCK